MSLFPTKKTKGYDNNIWLITLVIFSKFSPSTAGSHFQRTCYEKLKLLHLAQNCPLSVRCPLTIRARTSGRNFSKFDQRVFIQQSGNPEVKLFAVRHSTVNIEVVHIMEQLMQPKWVNYTGACTWADRLINPASAKHALSH